MNAKLLRQVEQARTAATEVLLHNARGPFHGLPRTAGWGYPEPYTRDWMIAAFGILLTDNARLTHALKKVLESLATNQTPLGHIPSLAHDSEDRGASDTTPLFLLATALYRIVTGEHNFLAAAVQNALTWMEYQSPADRVLVAQLPTSDWRDEQWVLGYGLYVNTLVYAYLQMYGKYERADTLLDMLEHFTLGDTKHSRYVHEGLLLSHKPYYALWSYKIYKNERFDLLGNSLAILTGIAPPSRAKNITAWVETECKGLREKRELAVELPPNLFPYIQQDHPDWRERYAEYNQPGEYHNGGIWPWICGFYIAALVAVGKYTLAEKRLAALTELVRNSADSSLEYGFNEWYRAQDGSPHGQDWQTWSASMYIYASECVLLREVPFFDMIRKRQ